MDFELPEPIFDHGLYSEQMHLVLSDEAKTCRTVVSPPKKKFDREKFLSAMDEAFTVIGGVPRMALWADRNLTEFYKLMGKTIPQAQMLDIMGKMTHQILPALPPPAFGASMRTLEHEKVQVESNASDESKAA